MAAYFHVTDDIVADVQKFRSMHGRRWKAALRDLWTKSDDLREPWLRGGFSPLRWVRDVVGPDRLGQFERQLIAEGKLQRWERPPVRGLS